MFPSLFLLMIFSITPLFSAEDISSIQKQILELENEKMELSRSLRIDEYEEMQKEMQGQLEMKQYRWPEGAESLEKAEEAERSSHSKEVKIKKIDKKLKKLKGQLERYPK